MAQRPEDLSIDYKKLLKLSVPDRVSYAKSSLGQDLMAALTPSQRAALFPKYYETGGPSSVPRALSGGTPMATSSGGGNQGKDYSKMPEDKSTHTPMPQAPQQKAPQQRAKAGWERRIEKMAADAGVTAPVSAPAPQASRTQSTTDYSGLSPKDMTRSVILDMAKSRGWTKEGTAALLGMTKQESSFNPYTVGDNGKSFGIFQVANTFGSNPSKSRLSKFVSIAQQKTGIADPLQYIRDVNAGKIKPDPKITKALIESSIEHFVDNDIDPKINNQNVQKALQSKSPEEATEYLLKATRPKNWNEQGKGGWEYSKRLKNAQGELETVDKKFKEQIPSSEKILGQAGKVEDGNPAQTGQIFTDSQEKIASKTQEKQSGATFRKQAITAKLKSQLDYAATKAGVEVEVFSGGQMSKAEAKKMGAKPRYKNGKEIGWFLPNGEGVRTGSDRHDDGQSADIKLWKDGRLLTADNPEDAVIMKNFVVESMRAGVTGVGHANNYMGPSSIHVGGGSNAVWGKKGDKPSAMIAQAFAEGNAARQQAPVDPFQWTKLPEFQSNNQSVEATVSKPLNYDSVPEAIRQQIENMETSDKNRIYGLMSGLEKKGVDYVAALNEELANNGGDATAIVQAAVEAPPGQIPPVLTGEQFSMWSTDATGIPNTDQRKANRKAGGVVVNLDTNSGPKDRQVRPEVIIPDDATPQERAAAQAYVDRVSAAYEKKFGKSASGKVLTHSENRARNPARAATGWMGGRPGTIHTEPYSINDAKAREFFSKDPEGIAALGAITAETLGTLPGAKISLPHSGIQKFNPDGTPVYGSDTGANADGTNEIGNALPIWNYLQQREKARAQQNNIFPEGNPTLGPNQPTVPQPDDGIEPQQQPNVTASSESSGILIANQPVHPDQPLTREQMAAIEIAKQMSPENYANYPEHVRKKFENQGRQGTPGAPQPPQVTATQQSTAPAPVNPPATKAVQDAMANVGPPGKNQKDYRQDPAVRAENAPTATPAPTSAPQTQPAPQTATSTPQSTASPTQAQPAPQAPEQTATPTPTPEPAPEPAPEPKKDEPPAMKEGGEVQTTGNEDNVKLIKDGQHIGTVTENEANKGNVSLKNNRVEVSAATQTAPEKLVAAVNDRIDGIEETQTEAQNAQSSKSAPIQQGSPQKNSPNQFLGEAKTAFMNPPLFHTAAAQKANFNKYFREPSMPHGPTRSLGTKTTGFA